MVLQAWLADRYQVVVLRLLLGTQTLASLVSTIKDNIFRCLGQGERCRYLGISDLKGIRWLSGEGL